MTDQETVDLVGRIHDTLAGADIHVAVEVRDGTVVLAGEVDSEENRQAALDVAHAVADPLGLRVDDTIDVLPDSPAPIYAEAGPDGAGHSATSIRIGTTIWCSIPVLKATLTSQTISARPTRWKRQRKPSRTSRRPIR